MRDAIAKLNAFVLGVIECRSDWRVIYYDKGLQRAYDRGKKLGTWLTRKRI